MDDGVEGTDADDAEEAGEAWKAVYEEAEETSEEREGYREEYEDGYEDCDGQGQPSDGFGPEMNTALLSGVGLESQLDEVVFGGALGFEGLVLLGESSDDLCFGAGGSFRGVVVGGGGEQGRHIEGLEGQSFDVLVLFGEAEGGDGVGIALWGGLKLEGIDDGCGEGFGFFLEGFGGGRSAGGEAGATGTLEDSANECEMG